METILKYKYSFLKFFIISLSLMFVACSSTKLEVTVLDKETSSPVPNAFIFTNEGNMMNPWNSNGIYLTNTNGNVIVDESGMVGIFAGKDGYDISYTSVYMNNMKSKDGKISIIMYIYPVEKYSSKINTIKIRTNNFYSKYSENYDIVKSFKSYCDKTGITWVDSDGKIINFQ